MKTSKYRTVPLPYYQQFDFEKAPFVETRKVKRKLLNTFFSRGHKGSRMGLATIEKTVDRVWIERKVPLDRILSRSHQVGVIKWIRKLAEKHDGPFPYFEEPIIIGPNITGQAPCFGNRHLTILDGWHRVAEALNRGYKTITVWVGEPDS